MSTAESLSPETMSRWTPKQKQQVLAALARELLGQNAQSFVPLNDESHRPVAYLLPAFDTSKELSSDFTPEYYLELLRRAATPEVAVSWQEMQSLLDADDATGSR